MPTLHLGCTRVGTNGPMPDVRLDQLCAEDRAEVYRETTCGARPDGCEPVKLLKMLAARDVVTVTRTDRLADSSFDLLVTTNHIVGAGGQFWSRARSWANTGTSTGRLMIAVPDGLTDVERDLVRIRSPKGRSRAKACGQHIDRPLRLTDEQKAAGCRRRADGATPDFGHFRWMSRESSDCHDYDRRL